MTNERIELFQDQIDKAVEIFREQYTKATELSANPKDLKWAIFPTGDLDIEYKSASAIIENLLENIAVFHYYKDVFTNEQIAEELEGHLKELEAKIHVQKLASSAEDNDLKLTMGV